MQDSLSIRSYSKQPKSHAHSYHQLVLPLQGSINIEVSEYAGKVVPGECIVIYNHEVHRFTALEQARFIVADLSVLPESITQSRPRIFTLDSTCQHYLGFIEKLLQNCVPPPVIRTAVDLFQLLLETQQHIRLPDKRIQQVQAYILENLHADLSIKTLAQIAYLSPTQFKKHFTAQLGAAPATLISRHRMEKARALLTHTDLPVQQVAEQVGYSDLSAFSRRFTRHFGLSPRQVKR